MIDKLQQLYPDRTVFPETSNDIPKQGYMVYILTFNENPIVIGHGQRNRARVIFDDINQVTNHFKALLIRLYNLYGNGNFKRYFIKCNDKKEAMEIEKILHNSLGGNKRNLPIGIRSKLFEGLEPNSITYLVLEIALRSSYNGLDDIHKWRRDGILNDLVWSEISHRLHL